MELSLSEQEKKTKTIGKAYAAMLPKKMHILILISLLGCSTGVVFGNQDPFIDSTIELPFRELKQKPVKDILNQNLRIADFLGIQPLKGQTIAAKPEVCPSCEAEKHAFFEDEKIGFEKVGDFLDLKAFLSKGSQIFIRDQKVATFDESQLVLRATGFGETELFLVSGSEMTIAKIQVGEENDLVIDQALTQIQEQDAGKGRVYARISKPYSSKTVARSIRESDLLEGYGMEDEKTLLPKISERLVLKQIAIQLVDQFSGQSKRSQKIVSGVDVSLLGSDFVARTDARGIVEISDIPAGSRFFARISDRQGSVRNQLIEIATSRDPEDELFVVRTVNSDMFDVFTEAAEVTQYADLSSLCLTVMSPNGTQALAGIRVEITNEVEGEELVGPIYFNDLTPTKSRSETNYTGKFCYFNLLPGLLQLRFSDDEGPISSAVVPIGEATHLEDSIYLTNGMTITARTVALPSVTDLVYRDEDSHGYLPVDYMRIDAVGEEESLTYLAPGISRLEPGFTFYRGRLIGIADSGDFEPSLFLFDEVTKSNHGHYFEVLTLLQQGFVEDLSNALHLQDGLASIAYNSELGRVFVRHGVEEGLNAESLNFKLIDQSGREVSSAWFFGTTEDGFVEGMFFNVETGIYTMIVETAENHWIDVTTVPVEDEFTTIVQTGNQISPQP